MRNFDLYCTERQTFSWMFAWRNAALVNRTRRTGPNTCVPFLEIFTESGGSVSCDTQLNCRALLTMATALLSSPFLGYLLVVLKPSSAGLSTLRRIFDIPIYFCRIDIREDANTHKVIWCKYLPKSIYTAVDWPSQTGSASGVSFSRHFDPVFLEFVAQRVVRLSVSVSHDCHFHAGNCIGLPSNTGLFLSAGNKQLFLVQHYFVPCDSWPLHLFRFSCLAELCDLLLSSHQHFLASSARSPCNFGPLADLASSVFREVNINTVFNPNPHFTQAWALKMIHEKNWRVSLCVQKFYHPQDFLWILAAIPVIRNGTGLTVLDRGLRFYLVLDFWLAWSTVSPFFPFNMFTWHSYGIGICPTQVFPCSGLTVAWHSCGWWGRRAWGRRGMIDFLHWTCHGCWRRQAGGRTRW